MKRRKLKAHKRSTEAPAPAPAPAPSYSADDLLDRAEALLEDEAEVDAAQRFCLRALELDSSSPRALRLCGLLLLESGPERRAEAQFCLRRVVELCGAESAGAGVHLYLGQLASGAEAVEHYVQGIALLRSELEAQAAGATGGGDAPTTSRWRQEAPSWRRVSDAHCAVAELFLTDLCDEPEAEERCRAAIEEAMQADPSNPEALHLRTTFLLVKQQPEAAREAMQQCLALWLPKLRSAIGHGEAENGENGEEDGQKPTASVTQQQQQQQQDTEKADEQQQQKEKSDEQEEEEHQQQQQDVTAATGMTFDSRLKCAQTLLELQMADEAAEVLESCHAENDEDVQVLYLFAMALFQLWERAAGSQDEEEVGECAENARTLLTSALDAAKEGEETEVEEHVREMLTKMEEKGWLRQQEEEEEEEPQSSGDEEQMEEG